LEKAYLNKNTYHTSEDHPRSFFDKLALNTRLYFFYKYFGVVLKSRKKVINGVYDTRAWYESSQKIFDLIENCGGKFHLEGLENIDSENGPYVFISNHMSALETMIFPGIIAPKTELTFVVKESLINYPFFGPIMQSRKPIVVSRENSREDLFKVINEGKEKLSNGSSIVIFPQSTRRTDLIHEAFNTLGVKLASKAKVKVIPIAIKTDFWGNSRFIKDLGSLHREKPIYMEFGKAIDITGNGKDDNQNIFNFISDRLKQWSD
jgi:1-acyl-sn-glycerol-3-phosphate acyltransferase